jgi:hypothetical protein
MNKLLLLILLLLPPLARGQNVKKYDLKQLLAGNKLSAAPGAKVSALNDEHISAVTEAGITYLTGIDFKTGEIELDLRGSNRDNQSFIGIAFNVTDTAGYECLYFRPFNFRRTTEKDRQLHAVQYESVPENPWYKLRQDHPLVYENTVKPAPDGSGWFHARIVVTDNTVAVYVDHSATPSLTVQRLNKQQSNKIALWNFNPRDSSDPSGTNTFSGDFANLTITTN